MASKELSDLELDFRNIVQKFLLPKCEQLGVKMRPFYTIRNPWEQAKLWRQSRTSGQIKTAIADLKEKGAPFLAHVLDLVGPQYGRWATNALPGISWHQHGLAIDCFVLEDGKAIWNSKHKGYQTYARAAVEVGLVAGYYWQTRDAVHVQKFIGRVLDRYKWPEVDKLMIQLYGNEEKK